MERVRTVRHEIPPVDFAIWQGVLASHSGEIRYAWDAIAYTSPLGRELELAAIEWVMSEGPGA